MTTPPASPLEQPPPFRLATGLWLSGIILCLVWSGCSIEKYYDTLTIFFDGVPNPEARARAEAAGGITADIRKSPTFTVHRPFADDACNACHNESFQLSGQDSGLCIKCHADRTTEFPRMHGPVVAVACLWCHAPHESAEAHLLKKPARQVCSQCHEPGMLSAAREPAHADTSRGCLDCHSGHGGVNQFFLRDGAHRPAPDASPTPPTPK